MNKKIHPHFLFLLHVMLFLAYSISSLAQTQCLNLLNEAPGTAQQQTIAPQTLAENPQISAKTRQDRIQEAQIQLEKLRILLAQAKVQIKKDLVGMDELIEAISRRIFLIWDGKANMKPQEGVPVEPLFGFSGVGKTAVVEAFAKALGMTVTTITVPKDAYYIPVEKILANGRPQVPGKSNSDPGPIDLNLDFIILIDEIQNLKPEAERKNFLAKAPPRDEMSTEKYNETVNKMNDSERVLWDILGSGTTTDLSNDPTNVLDSTSSYTQYINAYIDENVSFEERLRKARQDLQLLSPENNEDQRPRLEKQISDLEKAIRTNNKRITEYNVALDDLIETLKEKHGPSLGEFANISTKDIRDKIIDFPTEFRRIVLKNYANLRKVTPKMSFTGGLVFVAGNPEKIISDLRAKSRNRDGQVDPNLLRRFTEELPPQAMLDFFNELFGTTRAGWQTRWGLSKWKMLKPFSEEIWKNLVRSRIQNRLEQIQTSFLNQHAKRIDFEIGEGFLQSLYESEIDAAGGARQSRENLDSALATLSLVVPEILQNNLPDSSELFKFRIQNIERSTDVKLTGISPASQNIEFRIKLPRTINIANNENVESPVGFLQLAMYQAARVVVGTTLMGSFPRSAIELTPGASQIIDSQWASPDVTDVRHLQNKMAIALAGFHAERLFLGESGIVMTKYAELDTQFVEQILSVMKNELGQLETIARRRYPGEYQLSIDHLFPNSSLRFDRILDGIYRNQTEWAFLALDERVGHIIRSQPNLIRALAASFARKPKLSPEEIQILFRQHANQRPVVEQSRFRQIFDRAMRWIRRNPRPVDQVVNISVEQILNSEPGSIQNSLQHVEIAPAVRKPRQTLTQRMVERLSRLRANSRQQP